MRTEKTLDAAAYRLWRKADRLVVLRGRSVMGEHLVRDADSFDTKRRVLQRGNDIGDQHAFVVGFDQDYVAALAVRAQRLGIERRDGGAIEDGDIHILGSFERAPFCKKTVIPVPRNV